MRAYKNCLGSDVYTTSYQARMLREAGYAEVAPFLTRDLESLFYRLDGALLEASSASSAIYSDPKMKELRLFLITHHDKIELIENIITHRGIASPSAILEIIESSVTDALADGVL